MNSVHAYKVEVYRLLAEYPDIDLTPALTGDGICWNIGCEDIGFLFSEPVELDNWKMVLLFVRSCVAALKAYREVDEELYPPSKVDQPSVK